MVLKGATSLLEHWKGWANALRNDVAPLKTITYCAIKTTGTLIVITMQGMVESLSAFRQKKSYIFCKFSQQFFGRKFRKREKLTFFSTITVFFT